MYLQRLAAQLIAIVIGCACTAVYADANYSQRAKEQAERAATAAAIAAEQLQAARATDPASRGSQVIEKRRKHPWLSRALRRMLPLQEIPLKHQRVLGQQQQQRRTKAYELTPSAVVKLEPVLWRTNLS